MRIFTAKSNIYIAAPLIINRGRKIGFLKTDVNPIEI